MLKPITFTGCIEGARKQTRARLATDCTRVVAADVGRNSRAECEKAHRRFLADLQRAADRIERRRYPR